MVGLRVILAAIVLAIATGVVFSWDSAVQRQVPSRPVLKQMKLRTDGSGDRAVIQRRALFAAQPWARPAVIGAASLALALLIVCGRRTDRAAQAIIADSSES